MFAGDKRTYQACKSAFTACIDNAPATGEYKLLQLRQYLTGEALRCIENLGHSAIAYEAAKERLERKYGGKRRQIAIYHEELEQFRYMRAGNANDLESFADLLDIAIISLQEAGQEYELGDGSLYTKLQRKLPEPLLARYHRWVYENNISESVLTLRSWVLKESEVQTVASETVHGVNGCITDTPSAQPVNRYRSLRHSFGIKQIITVCRICSAGCVEHVMAFGSVMNSYRRASRKDETLRNGYNYVIAVWQRDMPENSVKEVGSAGKTDA